MRSRSLHPAAYLFAFLLWIVVGVVALGAAPAHARAMTERGPGETVSLLSADLRSHGAIVAADEPEGQGDLDGVEPAENGETSLGWGTAAVTDLPPKARPVTSLPAPESVILARLFEVSLAARGPPRA